jgi:hypothetical protein
MTLTLEARDGGVEEPKILPRSTQLMAFDIDAFAFSHIPQSVLDAGVGDPFASMIPDRSDHIDFTPSYSQGMEGVYNPASGFPEEMASQNSNITDFHQLHSFTPHTYDTWRQS